MATTKLGLPTITDNLNADVVRDMNALAEAIDAKAGVTGGLATIADITAHKAEDASETTKGHVQFATNAEITTGTDNTKAVHPAGLKVELDKKITENPAVTWISPTLLNGWVNYSGSFSDVKFSKDALGVVCIRGFVKNGTIGSSAFILPINYRPLKSIRAATVSNGAFGHVEISSDGNVIPLTGSNASFSLDNLSFKSEQ